MKTLIQQFKYDVHLVISSTDELDVSLLKIIRRSYLNVIDSLLQKYKKEMNEQPTGYQIGVHFTHIKYLKEQRKLIQDHE